MIYPDGQKIEAGQKVLWHYETTRGWGADYWVKAEVIKINIKRIRIKALTKSGSWSEMNVCPDKLKLYDWSDAK